MKRILPVAMLVSLAFSPLQTWPQAEPTIPKTRILRVMCLPARPLALTVALEQGFFTSRGMEVQAQIAANSEQLRSVLAAGSADLAHAAVDNAVALVEKTGADVAILMGGEGSTNELIAQPGTASIERLRGSTVIVDAPTTAYAIQLKKMLLLHGLQPERDYQIKAVGGTPMRLVAMRDHKEYAASILGPPTSLIAKHEGFVSLGTTEQVLGPYQGIGAFVQRNWAKENRALLVDYIAAYVEAQRWILDPSHKQQVVALLAREFKFGSELAEETYDSWVVAPGGMERDASLDLAGLQTVLRLRDEVEHTWNGTVPGPERYYDPSYYRASLEQLGSKK